MHARGHAQAHSVSAVPRRACGCDRLWVAYQLIRKRRCGVGGDAGADAKEFDGASSEVGRCYYEGQPPSSGIACAAGSICVVTRYEAGPGSGPLTCVQDDAAPLNCGPVGCRPGWPGCTCTNVPAGQCACNFLTSTARAKREIAYVDESTETRLHDDVMSVRLATYRYKPGVTGEDAQHLGFIIEDMPEGSPAVLASRDRVDLYGYMSMAVATLKVQERELEALKKRVARLEAERATSCASSK